jgi:hypothetical protein
VQKNNIVALYDKIYIEFLQQGYCLFLFVVFHLPHVTKNVIADGEIKMLQAEIQLNVRNK